MLKNVGLMGIRELTVFACKDESVAFLLHGHAYSGKIKPDVVMCQYCFIFN